MRRGVLVPRSSSSSRWRGSFGQSQYSVPVGYDYAAEELVAGAFAVPLAQRTAGFACLLGEGREEVIDFDLVVEMGGAGDPQRDIPTPAELCAVDPEFGGDDAGASLVEDPVERRAAVALPPGGAESVEHPQFVEPLSRALVVRSPVKWRRRSCSVVSTRARSSRPQSPVTACYTVDDAHNVRVINSTRSSWVVTHLSFGFSRVSVAGAHSAPVAGYGGITLLRS